jgi:hypothetical protein
MTFWIDYPLVWVTKSESLIAMRSVSTNFRPVMLDVEEVCIKDLPRNRLRDKNQGCKLDKIFMNLFGKLYFDSSGFQRWLPITKATLLTVKPQRRVFGTDYGFEMIEAQDIRAFIDNIKSMKIPEADRRAILGDTARELFKIR